MKTQQQQLEEMAAKINSAHMENNNSKKQKTIKIRIAVVIDLDGNWSAGGAKGEKDQEMLGIASENDILSGSVQTHYFVNVEVPLPSKPIELCGALTVR